MWSITPRNKRGSNILVNTNIASDNACSFRNNYWWLVFSVAAELSSCLPFLLPPPIHSLCVVREMPPAFENEVLRNPKPSLVDRSVLELSADKLVPPDIYVDRALLRGRLGSDNLYEAGGPMREHRLPWGDSTDSDSDLVAKAKARFQELQVETETLEEAYRNYQQRAVRSTLAHMLPQRAPSPKAAHLQQLSRSPLRNHIPNPSHIYSPGRSKVSHRTSSSQNAAVASAAVYDIREDVAPTKPKDIFPERAHQIAIQPSFLNKVGFQVESSCGPGHLSSSPYSSPKTSLRRKTAEGNSSFNSLCLSPASELEMKLQESPIDLI